ncbi:MAG: DUF3365 domain-containing protein [Cyclobacteriaceae bacterium]|jgi:hypothetical protein|nr:DUF3365 domain-containing protein [Cyclobacteriaceae bacterium]
MRNTVILMLFSLFILTACNKKQKEQPVVAEVPDSVYLNQGDQLIAVTFDTLRNSLTAAIGLGGFAHAIQFCNEKAYPLTNTYAEEGISIRRSSPKFRNPSNQPDSLEQVVFNEFLINGPKPRLIRTSQEVHYIKPIIMQGMCLNCHGKPGENIQPETLQAVATLYPEDRATGYTDGELRGIWHIAFKIK